MQGSGAVGAGRGGEKKWQSGAAVGRCRASERRPGKATGGQGFVPRGFKGGGQRGGGGGGAASGESGKLNGGALFKAVWGLGGAEWGEEVETSKVSMRDERDSEGRSVGERGQGQGRGSLGGEARARGAPGPNNEDRCTLNAPPGMHGSAQKRQAEAVRGRMHSLTGHQGN